MRANIQLHCEDCLPAMRKMADNQYSLAIVDPPYGIDINKMKIGANKNKKTWDSAIPTKEYFDELFRVSKNQIIWGMNFLNDYLPRCEKTIIWDKQNDGTFMSDYELAWTSIKGVRQEIFRLIWYGYFYPKDEFPLLHPTQKPIAVYKWLLRNYANPGDKILDTHFGSLSIGITCWDYGYDLTAYEIDKDYFEAGKKRLEIHKAQLQIY